MARWLRSCTALRRARHDGENRFKDVSDDAYYAEAVRWAVEQNVTEGTSGNTFSPADACTRSQIVAFLYRYFVG